MLAAFMEVARECQPLSCIDLLNEKAVQLEALVTRRQCIQIRVIGSRYLGPLYEHVFSFLVQQFRQMSD